MSSETPEIKRRPPNLSRKALALAKPRAKLAGKKMAAWISLAILEKASREEQDPSAISKTSLTEEMLRPVGRPPQLAQNVIQVAKVRSAIAGKTMTVWMSEALFEKAEQDSEGSKAAPKKLVLA